jgi:hypothetical protein
MMPKISLSNGGFAEVSIKDFDRVNALRWRRSMRGYVRSQSGSSQEILLHRFVMDAKSGTRITFRDGDRSNCKRGNLVIATHSDIAARRQRLVGRHGYIGVNQNYDKRFRASIDIRGTHFTLGFFKTAEQAARIYDAASRYHHGSLARTNFEGTERASAVSIRRKSRIRIKTSNYPGVVWAKGKYYAKVWFRGKCKHLGTFDDEKCAADAVGKFREMNPA